MQLPGLLQLGVLLFAWLCRRSHLLPDFVGIAVIVVHTIVLNQQPALGKASDVQVNGRGVVTRILSDDTSGNPHQRFIVRLASGPTVLIEHNTALAQRIEALNEGDTVGFSGEYVWNEQGGIVHWTHHDPAERHIDGWLKRNGRIYQ